MDQILRYFFVSLKKMERKSQDHEKGKQSHVSKKVDFIIIIVITFVVCKPLKIYIFLL